MVVTELARCVIVRGGVKEAPAVGGGAGRALRRCYELVIPEVERVGDVELREIEKSK